jgi:hypothetical protein
MKIQCIFMINLLQATFPLQLSFKHVYTNFLKCLTFNDVTLFTQAVGYPLSSKYLDYAYNPILQ